MPKLPVMPSPSAPDNVLKVGAQQEVLRGVYSNLALIHHTNAEFIVDFIMQFGGEAQMVARVIMSPTHMKAFKAAVEENIRLFEEKNKNASQDNVRGA